MTIKKKSCVLLTFMLLAMLTMTFAIGVNATEAKDLTRGEAVQLLFMELGDKSELDHNRYLGHDYAETSFEDIAEKPYTEAVLWAENRGMVRGNGNRRFDGDRAITRAEFATILYRESNLIPVSAELIGKYSLYADYSDVPEWAIDTLVLAIEDGVIEIAYNQRINPNGGLSKTEFSSSITKLMANAAEWSGLFPNPDQIDYSAATARNTVTDAEIYLGMTVAELSSILGFEIEDGWTNRVDDIMVGCLYDSAYAISFIMAPDSNWEINGVGTASTKEDIETAFGQPSVFTPRGSGMAGIYPRTDVATYSFDAMGQMLDSNDGAAYYVDIGYNPDGSLASIGISTFSSPDVPVSAPSRGVINISASGSGDYSFFSFVERPYIEISYSGTDTFAIYKGDDIIFSRIGPYNGVILLEDIQQSELEIRAVGEWSIKGKYNINPNLIFTSDGTGDYVIPAFSLHGSYRITHDGSGEFIVKAMSQSSASSDFEDVVFVDTVGSFSDILEIQTDFTEYIVIKADGNWTFERQLEIIVIDAVD